MILSRLRSRFLPRRASPRPVRGTVSSVIVVREPAPCFREALFVLRDEYLADPSRDREELMREAREAAAAFSGAEAPRRKPWLLPAALAGLGAAALAVWYFLLC